MTTAKTTQSWMLLVIILAAAILWAVCIIGAWKHPVIRDCEDLGTCPPSILES